MRNQPLSPLPKGVNRKTFEWKQINMRGCQPASRDFRAHKDSFIIEKQVLWVTQNCDYLEPAKHEWAALPFFTICKVTQSQIWQSSHLYANQTESRTKSIGFDMPEIVILLTLLYVCCDCFSVSSSSCRFYTVLTLVSVLCWSICSYTDFHQKNMLEDSQAKHPGRTLCFLTSENCLCTVFFSHVYCRGVSLCRLVFVPVSPPVAHTHHVSLAPNQRTNRLSSRLEETGTVSVQV